MLKNKIIVRKIRNIIMLLIVLMIMLGAYQNIRKSRAENVIEIMMEVSDKNNILSAQTVTAEATETSDGKYLLELPVSVNQNIVTKYYTSEGEEIAVQYNGEVVTLQLTEEEVTNKKIQLETNYDTKEVSYNEETKTLYNKELNYNDEIIITGYMPLDSKIQVSEIAATTLANVTLSNENQTIQKGYDVSVFETVEKTVETVVDGIVNTTIETEDVEYNPSIYEEQLQVSIHYQKDSEVEQTVTIYGLDDNSKLTQIESTLENENIIFTSNSILGKYVVVVENIETSTEEIPEDIGNIMFETQDTESGTEENAIATVATDSSATLADFSSETTADSAFWGNTLGITRANVSTIRFVVGEEGFESFELATKSYWNVDAGGTGTIKAYYQNYGGTGSTDGYHIWIYSDSTIYAPVNSSYLFANIAYTKYYSYNGVSQVLYGLENLDVSKVTKMSYMFDSMGMAGMTKLDLGSNFYTTSATDMSYMFNNLAPVTLATLDLGDNFKTDKVTNMEKMFCWVGYSSSNFTTLNLGYFETKNVTNMKNMFNGCGYTAMTSLYLGEIFQVPASATTTGMLTDLGKSGCVIYCYPKDVYLHSKALKIYGTSNGVYYSRGTVYCGPIFEFSGTDQGGNDAYYYSGTITIGVTISDTQLTTLPTSYNYCIVPKTDYENGTFSSTPVWKTANFGDSLEIGEDLNGEYMVLVERVAGYNSYSSIPRNAAQGIVGGGVWMSDGETETWYHAIGWFKFDKTAPTITVSPSATYNNSTYASTNYYVKNLNITITASDTGGAGLSNSNEYEYYLSKYSTSLSGGEWKEYTNGEEITLDPGTTGTYYLFVKTVQDNAKSNGNVSSSNGTMTTISSVKYHRFGTYRFDNTAPTITASPQSNTEWAKEHSVTVTLKDSNSGLVAGSNIGIKYGWSTSETTAPTSYKTVTLSNSAGATSTTFTANGSGYTGIYYLWVVPTSSKYVKDRVGNVNNTKVISGPFYFDNTAPTITIEPTSDDTWRVEQTANVTLTDEHSGFAANQLIEIRYGWSTSTTTAPSIYDTITLASIEDTTSITFKAGSQHLLGNVEDEYYLWVEPVTFEDKVTNSQEETTKSSGMYYYDYEPPQISLSEESNEVWAKSHNVTVTLADEGSGLGTTEVEYGWAKLNDDGTITEPANWKEVNSSTFTATTDSLVTESGKYYLWVRPSNLTDQADDERTDCIYGTANTGPNSQAETTKSSGVFWLDIDNPEWSYDSKEIYYLNEDGSKTEVGTAGKNFVNRERIAEITLKGTDATSDLTMSLSLDDIIVKVVKDDGTETTVSDSNKELIESNVSGKEATYKLKIIGLTDEDGTLTVVMPSGSLTDKAGNINNGVTLTTDITVDNISPSLTLAITNPEAGIYKAGQEITITATYDATVLYKDKTAKESISSMTDAPIMTLKFGGAEAKGEVECTYAYRNAFTYKYTITGADNTEGNNGDNGTLSISLEPVYDAAGNEVSASDILSSSLEMNKEITADTIEPTLVITSDKESATNAEIITYTFKFYENRATGLIEEAVTGFTEEDITISNGTKVTFSGSGSTYTLQVKNEANLTYDILVSVPDGVCTDIAGNDNTGANHTITVDRINPTVTVTPDKTTNTSANDYVNTPQNITITATDDLELYTDNEYKYYLLNSEDSEDILTTAEWQEYTNGEEITLNPGISGEYYLYAKPIKDNVTDTDKNISTTENYHKFGPYKFDYDNPTMTVEPNSNEWTNSKISATITVEDEHSGLSTSNEYKYNLATSSEEINDAEWKEYTSGTAFDIRPETSGEYYLFVKSISDNLGNVSSIDSINIYGPYKFDFENPTISISSSSSEWTNEEVNVTITANDIGGSGLLDSNEYEYNLVKNSEEIDDAEWKEYTSGTAFDIRPETSGEYYLYVKPVKDSVIDLDKNISTTESYHIFGPYKFDFDMPEWSYVSKEIYYLDDGTKTEIGEDGQSYINKERVAEITLKGTDATSNLTISLSLDDIEIGLLKEGETEPTPVSVSNKELIESSVSGKEAIYKLKITGLEEDDGTLTIVMPSGSLTDEAGNINNGDTLTTDITVDNINPNLSLDVTSPAEGIYNAGQEITITATYDEPIYKEKTTETLIDILGEAPTMTITFGGATAKETVTCSNVSGNVFTYKYTITGADNEEGNNGDNGTLAISLEPVYDVAGNEVSATNVSKEIIADTIAPIVTFNPTKNETWAKTHEVEVTINDLLSGLIEGANVEYGWALLNDDGTITEPNEYTTVLPTYSEDNKTATFTAVGNGITGKYYLWIKPISDNVGNISEIQKAGEFYFDNTAPTLATPPLEMKLGSESGDTYIDGTLTNQSVYIAPINGTDAHSGHASTTYSVNGGESQTTPMILNPGDGNEEIYTITVTSTDNAGNTITSEEYTIHIDKIRPEWTYVSKDIYYQTSNDVGTDDYTNADRTVKIVFKGTDTNAHTVTSTLTSDDIEVSVNGVAVSNENKNLETVNNETSEVTCTLTITGITGDGDLTIVIPNGKLTDTAGNQNIDKSLTTEVDIEVDNTNPVLSLDVTSPSAGIYKAGQEIIITAAYNENVYKEITSNTLISSKEDAPSMTLAFGGIDAKGTVECSDVSGNVFTYKYTIQDGDNGSLIITNIGRVYDIAGNAVSESDVNTDIIADTTAPIITFNPTQNETWAKTQEVEVAIKDEISGLIEDENVEYGWSTDDTTEPSEYIAVLPTYSVDDETGKLKATFTAVGSDITGKYYLWVKPVSDSVGNITETEKTGTFWFDNTLPTITLGTNSNETWAKTHEVEVTINDEHSGLKTGASITYGWALLNDDGTVTEPSNYTTATISSYSDKDASATFTAMGSDITGKYYLWVVPTTLSDYVGNTNTAKVESTGTFYFDNTAPIWSTQDFTINDDKTVTVKIVGSDENSGCASNSLDENDIIVKIDEEVANITKVLTSDSEEANTYTLTLSGFKQEGVLQDGKDYLEWSGTISIDIAKETLTDNAGNKNNEDEYKLGFADFINPDVTYKYFGTTRDENPSENPDIDYTNKTFKMVFEITDKYFKESEFEDKVQIIENNTELTENEKIAEIRTLIQQYFTILIGETDITANSDITITVESIEDVIAGTTENPIKKTINGEVKTLDGTDTTLENYQIIGKQFTLELSNLQQKYINVGENYLNYSGIVSVIINPGTAIDKGINGDDNNPNGNVSTTITSGIEISGGTKVDENAQGEVVDVVDPIWEYADTATAKPVDQIAIITIQGTDKYYKSNLLDTLSTVEEDELQAKIQEMMIVKVNGEIPGDINGNGLIDESEILGDTNKNGVIDAGETEITVQVEEGQELTEQRDSETVVYGKKYKITVNGYDKNAYQVSITLNGGLIEDESGNKNQATDFILFTSLVETSTETSANSKFLSKNASEDDVIPERQYVEKVIFKDNLDGINDTKWDVSQLNDGTIWAWYTTRESNGTTLYTVYIGSYIIINGNVNSSYLFANIGHDTNCMVTGDTETNPLIENLDLLHVDSVTNMSHMFDGFGYSNMETFELIDAFDTGAVTNMEGMFKDCGNQSMTTFTLGNGFNITNVENMNSMFQNFGQTKLQILDLGDDFSVANVTDMSNMFNGCGQTAMTVLDLGPKFTKIADTHTNFATNCGNSGTTIYVDESIYSNMKTFKPDSTNTKVTGTINPIYKPEWEKVSSTLTDDGVMTIVVKGYANKTFTNGEYTGTYLSDVTTSTSDFTVYIDGEQVDSITKNIVMGTPTKNETTGKTEIQATITLSGFGEEIRQKDAEGNYIKNFKEWSGNVSVQLAKGTLVDDYGNQNLEIIDTEVNDDGSTKTTDRVEIEDAIENSEQTGKMFIDDIKPEFTYEFSKTVINHGIENQDEYVIVVFDVTDKYFASSQLSTAENPEDLITIKLKDEADDSTNNQNINNNIVKELSEIKDLTYTTEDGRTLTVGKQYQLKISNLDKADGFMYSGPMSLNFGSGIITDQTGNSNDSMTITIGINETDGNPDTTEGGSQQIVDVVDPVWEMNSVDTDEATQTVTVVLKATDKYFQTSTLVPEQISVYIDGNLDSNIKKEITAQTTLDDGTGIEYTLKLSDLQTYSGTTKIIIPAGTIDAEGNLTSGIIDQYGNISNEQEFTLGHIDTIKPIIELESAVKGTNTETILINVMDKYLDTSDPLESGEIIVYIDEEPVTVDYTNSSTTGLDGALTFVKDFTATVNGDSTHVIGQQYQLVLSNFEQSTRNSDKYKDWSGTVSIEIAEGAVKDIEVENNITGDKSGGNINEETTLVGDFVDFIKPDIEYEYQTSDIDRENNTYKMTFSITDKYYTSGILSTTDITNGNVKILIQNGQYQTDENGNKTPIVYNLKDVLGTDSAISLTPTTEIKVSSMNMTNATTGAIEEVTNHTIGYEYTLTISNLEQLEINENLTTADYSGVISLIIEDNLIQDRENGNDEKTITSVVTMPDNTTSNVVDVVAPLITKVSTSVDAVDQTAIITINGTDTYFDESKLTADNIANYIKVFINGTEDSITPTIEETIELTETRLINEVETPNIQYGVQYKLKVSGFAQDINQLKIQVKQNMILDESGNGNIEKEFLIYNVLKKTSEENSGTSAFLGSTDTAIQRQNIENVTFLSDTSTVPETGWWDASAQGDNSIKAWATQTAEQQTAGTYTVYIASDYEIFANKDSSYLFAYIGYSENCRAEETVTNINLLNTSNVTHMYGMFQFTGYTAMTSLNLGNNFDTSNVTDMREMFGDCGYTAMTSLNLGNKFDTSNVLKMDSMFYRTGYIKMTTLNLGNNFDTSKVEIMSRMFHSCGYTEMTSLKLGDKFNTSNVTDMNYMFYETGYTAMTSLDLSSGTTVSNITQFNTSNVTGMQSMFYQCGFSAMTTLNLGNNFNTSSVTDMSQMFSGCGNTKMTSLDLGDKFDTQNVTNMNAMFASCGRSLMTTLELGDKFDTSEVEDMSSMFFNCGYEAMTALDLGDKFNTSKVTNMYRMFYNCGGNKLTSLDLGNLFYTTSVTDMREMFYGCGNKAMTVLDLGPAFTKIPSGTVTVDDITESAHKDFMKDCGNSVTIYAPEAIYADMDSFKVND